MASIRVRPLSGRTDREMKTETDILLTLLPAPAKSQCRMSAFHHCAGSRKSVSPYFSRIQSYPDFAHFYATVGQANGKDDYHV